MSKIQIGVGGKWSVKQVRAAARCKSDALVFVQEGRVRVQLALRDEKSEQDGPFQTTIADGIGRADLAQELAAKLKKDKKVWLWLEASEDKGVLLPRYLEIDEGVLYKAD